MSDNITENTTTYEDPPKEQEEGESSKDADLQAQLDAANAKLRVYEEGQTNPLGPNYNNPSQATNQEQTGTLVAPVDPTQIGYSPHVGDHSIDPATGLPRQ